MLTSQQIRQFKETGFVLLKRFYDTDTDVRPIQFGIYEIISLVAKRHRVTLARKPFDRLHFDDGFMQLIAADRRYGSEVYDAIKHIPAFHRLLSDTRHEEIFKRLRKEAFPAIVSGGAGIRIDIPHEEQFRSNWHQEYPAQLRSIDGVVFWSPLVPVDEALGPVQLCVASHLDGPIPVLTVDKKCQKRTGAYSLTLENESDLLKRYKKLAPTTDPGDLLLIDFLLLHASGKNVAHRPRWTMQFRYFNYNDPIGLNHGWSGSFAAGVDFKTIHPELCAD